MKAEWLYKLENIVNLKHDPKNPRKRDATKYALVKQSLGRLGFLLPLVVTETGLILSGHQRLDAARDLGIDHVPVQTLVTSRSHHALNILFNRGTNDFVRTDISRHVSPTLTVSECPPANPYRCMSLQWLPIADVLDANTEPFDSYQYSVSKSLYRAGVRYPLVVDKNLSIINGFGRLQLLAELGFEAVPCVVLPHKQAAFAGKMLNDLSMDFMVNEDYANLLRMSANRRLRATRRHLGNGFLFPIHKGRCKDFTLENPVQRKRWVEYFGRDVLDFGSGHGHEARLLRKARIKVACFEPYPTDKNDQPSLIKARRGTLKFLQRLETKQPFSAVFLSSVLNSVPFAPDRKHILTLCQALCQNGGRLFIATRSKNDPSYQEIAGKGATTNERGHRSLQFRLPEDDLILGDLSNAPKAQKFHDTHEIYELVAACFENCAVHEHKNNVCVIAERPRKIDRKKLINAIEFEFDLPFPGEKRLDLVFQAKKAFLNWLGEAHA